MRVIIVVGALAGAVVLATFAAPLYSQRPRDPKLAGELLARRDTDQAVRQELMRALQEGRTVDSQTTARIDAVDRRNTRWMQWVLARYGWPGRSLVGPAGAGAAFLLVQHSPDTTFQRHALQLLDSAVHRGEARAADYATLYDRVQLRAGRLQRFGTQARVVGGKLVFDPIEDSADVDARRAKVGLPSLGVYAKLLDSMYTSTRQP